MNIQDMSFNNLHHLNNDFTKTMDVCLSTTNTKCENKIVNDKVINYSKSHINKPSSHLLKLQTKELLLKDRLAILKETEDLLKSKRKLSLPKDNGPSSITYFKGKSSELKEIKKPKIEKFFIQNSIDKFESVSQTEVCNELNTGKEEEEFGLGNNIELTSISLNNAIETYNNSFEFVAVDESSLRTDLIMETEDTTFTQNVQALAFENCYVDDENNENKCHNFTTVKSDFPIHDLSDKVDSTGLRDGIIKASRTLINTQKTLKLLLNVLHREKKLPPQKAVGLLRRFQGILKSFKKGFEEIDQTVIKGYNQILMETNSINSVKKLRK